MQGQRLPQVLKSELSMTSHVPRYRTFSATGPIGIQLVPVTDVSSGTGDELKLEAARRRDDRYDEAERSAGAALFAGLFIGSGSTALMIWLATLVL